MAFHKFTHFLWEAIKPTIVLTDNNSVTRFFQTKVLPTFLWNACHFVLQFSFKIPLIAGSVITAADLFIRLELKVTEKIRLKNREDVQTTPINVTTSSSSVPDEEHFPFAQVDGEDETKEKTLERKEQSRRKATEWVEHEDHAQ